jgi:acetyl-CoA C-acetyltransferase
VSEYSDQAPVLIAAAQHTWREPDVSRTPIDALYSVAEQALADSQSPGIKGIIDTVATVRFIMDSDPSLQALLPRNPGAAVAAQLGLEDVTCYQTNIGGNTPQSLINHFAQKLACGTATGVLLSGVELLNTFFSALKSGGDISAWPGEPGDPAIMIGAEKPGSSDDERAHGLYEPINTYPLFEQALQHQRKVSRQEHMAEMAELCSRMSQRGAVNPHAWQQQALSAEQAADPSGRNRYIGFPYTKAMNAVLSVDMAAAVIMTTAAKAREIGVPEEQIVYLRAGADCNDIWHVTQRPQLHRAPAVGLLAHALFDATDIELADVDCFDIYSCFPSAVQIACNEIGLSPLDERGITVTGGLPFFGGPGNNYSLHAIAEVVTRLRQPDCNTALVTANGLYLTKHSMGLYSSHAPTSPWQAVDSAALQQQIDDSPRLPLCKDDQGTATIAACTVAFDRNGPARAILVLDTEAGERLLANSCDEQLMRRIIEEDMTGVKGQFARGETTVEFSL